MKTKPKDVDYIKSKIRSFGEFRVPRFKFNLFRRNRDVPPPDGGWPDYSVDVDMPDHLGKYYINEDYAKAGEDVLRMNRRNIYVGVRVLDGECRMQDIYVYDTPLMEYLESK